jgi:hypothetical protein
MARRHDPKELREIIGALDEAGVPMKEVERRLKAGQVGMRCGSLSLSRSTLYRHLADYRAEHGLPERLVDDNATAHSIEALEDRTVKLLAREIAKLEQKRPGKLTAQDISKLNKAHQAMVQMRNRIKGKGRQKKPIRPGAQRNEEKAASALEQLAERQREAEAA